MCFKTSAPFSVFWHFSWKSKQQNHSQNYLYWYCIDVKIPPYLTCLPGLQQSVQHCFPQPFVGKLGRYRLDGWSMRWVGNWLIAHTQRVWLQWLLLRLATCHKRGPPGVDTGPHAIQHLHKWSGWWDWKQPHQVCWRYQTGWWGEYIRRAGYLPETPGQAGRVS